jgi:hypothetical protein
MSDLKTLPQVFLVTADQLTAIFNRPLSDIYELLNRVKIAVGEKKLVDSSITVDTAFGSDVYYKHDVICPLMVTEIIKHISTQLDNSKQEVDRATQSLNQFQKRWSMR